MNRMTLRDLAEESKHEWGKAWSLESGAFIIAAVAPDWSDAQFKFHIVLKDATESEGFVLSLQDAEELLDLLPEAIEHLKYLKERDQKPSPFRGSEVGSRATTSGPS